MTSTMAEAHINAAKATTVKGQRMPPAHRVFENSIVDLVYSIQIKRILAESPDISLTSLAGEFSGRTNCSVSPSTMKRWLQHMGITHQRTTTWTGLKDAES